MILKVDITDAIPSALSAMIEMGGEQIEDAILDDISEMAWLYWRNIAVRELRSSRQSYVDGILRPVAAEGERTITLEGWLPNAVENGIPSYDLRDTVLGSGSSIRKPILETKGGERKQVGWYAHVPFRHGTPTSSGLAGGPMGSQYAVPGGASRAGKTAVRSSGAKMTSVAAKEFGKSVYAAAKKLKGKQRTPAGLPKLYEHHTTSIFTGMRRVRKPYVNPRTGKTTTQSQYFTFRTISTQKKEGWIHPGIEPRRFAKRVEKYVIRMAPRVVKNIVDAAMKAGG